MIQNGPITQIGPIEKGSNVVAKQLFGQCANSKAASRRGIWSCEGRRAAALGVREAVVSTL